MQEEYSLHSVNEHYLDKVMDLAEERDVKATEDIFDARGMKLVSKGARISRSVQERLILRRLSKPLEASIAVDGGIDTDVILREARHIMDTVEPVRLLVSATHGEGSPLQILAGIRFGNAMSTMLTIVEKGGAKALTHSVIVSLLSVCLARRFGLGINEQSSIALAGLLHDIGELYVQPEYLTSSRRLYPHEWRHVIVHPRIGQMLIENLEDYPPVVAQAVLEHHERFNGSGYPRQVGGGALSAAGQVISVAEMISGVFMRKDKALQRAELALKIIPGEHPHALLSAVTNAMRNAGDGHAGDATTISREEHDTIRQLHQKIGAVRQTVDEMREQPALRHKKVQQLLEDASRRTAAISRAFSSTGLDAFLDDGNGFFDTHSLEIMFETAVVTGEIRWRLRDIARDLSLHAASLEPEHMDALQSLIELIDAAD